MGDIVIGDKNVLGNNSRIIKIEMKNFFGSDFNKDESVPDSGIVETEEADYEEVKDDAAELSDDDRTVRAIGILNTEKLIKHKYDYTWVMQVTNETDGMPSYDSPQSFLTDMKRLQKEAGLNFEVGLPDISNMNKELSEVTGTFPNWRFIDMKKTKALGHTVYRDTTETNRRINIAKRYYNAFRKEYKTIDNT